MRGAEQPRPVPGVRCPLHNVAAPDPFVPAATPYRAAWSHLMKDGRLCIVFGVVHPEGRWELVDVACKRTGGTAQDVVK